MSDVEEPGEDEFTIIIESQEDYNEAVTALAEQIEAAELLSENIALVAEAIDRYEKENNINVEES